MFFIIILILIVAFLANQIRIVPQQTCFVIERLGKYYTEWEAGLHIKTPVIDKMVKKISLKEKVYDFPPQDVITKDNVSIKIDSVVYASIFDPYKYTYGIENPIVGLRILLQQLSEALSEKWNWMQRCLQGLKSMEECRLFLMKPQMNGVSK